MVKYRPPSTIEVALYSIPEAIILLMLYWYGKGNDVGVIWYVLVGVGLVSMVISSVAYRINHKLDWMIEQNKNGH